MSKMGLSMNLDCCSIKTQTAAANYLWISTLTSVHHSQRASKLFFFCTFVGLPTIKIQNKTKNAAQNVSLKKKFGSAFFYLSAASEICLRNSPKIRAPSPPKFTYRGCLQPPKISKKYIRLQKCLLLRFTQTAPAFSSELFSKFTHLKMNFDGVFILVFPP